MPLPGERRKAGAVADDIGNGLERRTQQTVLGTGRRGQGNEARRGSASLAVNGYWADADWIACRDGKARPAIPAAVLLAHGHSADMGVLCAAEEFAGSRTGMLRAFGNAIVGPQAAEFVRAFMEVRP